MVQNGCQNPKVIIVFQKIGIKKYKNAKIPLREYSRIFLSASVSWVSTCYMAVSSSWRNLDMWCLSCGHGVCSVKSGILLPSISANSVHSFSLCLRLILCPFLDHRLGSFLKHSQFEEITCRLTVRDQYV